jgi:hypothetical protein
VSALTKNSALRNTRVISADFLSTQRSQESQEDQRRQHEAEKVNQKLENILQQVQTIVESLFSPVNRPYAFLLKTEGEANEEPVEVRTTLQPLPLLPLPPFEPRQPIFLIKKKKERQDSNPYPRFRNPLQRPIALHCPVMINTCCELLEGWPQTNPSRRRTTNRRLAHRNPNSFDMWETDFSAFLRGKYVYGAMDHLSDGWQPMNATHKAQMQSKAMWLLRVALSPDHKFLVPKNALDPRAIMQTLVNTYEPTNSLSLHGSRTTPLTPTSVECRHSSLNMTM